MQILTVFGSLAAMAGAVVSFVRAVRLSTPALRNLSFAQLLLCALLHTFSITGQVGVCMIISCFQSNLIKFFT